jgi:hypothetical protein
VSKKSPAREKSLAVEVPTSEEDRPRLARVGIVAGVGFVIGIIWPWLAGVRLVPRPPEEARQTTAPVAASASASAAAPAAAKATPAKVPKKPEAPKPGDRVKVGAATITSCRTAQGDKVDNCDAIELDDVAAARIKALGGCKAARTAVGLLSLGLELDFGKNSIERLSSGRSTTLPERTAQALLTCAKREFSAASLTGVKHEHASYTVFYRVELLPPGKTAAEDETESSDGEELTAASGMATVSWNVAIIRDVPNKDGALVARIASGTRVAVVGRNGDWYKVKYDAKGSEGWVYRGALGL